MFDYIVVGAGFAGCVMAERIASQLNKKVLIVERKKHIGGHCYDYKDEHGIIIHRYGPHLFHTNHKHVWEYLSQFTEWHYYQHKVLAYVDGKKIPIPFNLNSLYYVFPDSLANKIESKLLQFFNYNQRVPILELRKIDDPDIRFLSEFVYENIFLNYTTKQWGIDPEHINPEVTSRVPVFIGRDDRYFIDDKYQGVPKYGYSRIFKNIVSHPNINLLLGVNFNEFCKIRENNILIDNIQFKGKIIYTGMIDELFEFRFGELPYRTLNLEFKKLDQIYFQENAVVNYPNNYDFTRITEFKHIHPVDTKFTHILLEYPGQYIRGISDPFYPLFTDDAKNAYHKYLDLSKQYKNLILLGRLAEFKYYDMDDVIDRALRLFNIIFND
ncbi:MAG: UDP-galactopyranose mutase [Thermaceae bacterium]|nr:UDP-galactopyranose mutase [Thermaceae bacterium]